MTASIRQLTRFDAVADGHFRGAFDASWNQGPGTFGGLLAGTLGQTLERAFPDRALRALSMHLCAPAAPGPLDVYVAEARRGSAVTFATARIEREGRAIVIASATLARPRTGDADFEHSTPVELKPREACREFDDAPGIPVFTKHFRMLFDRGVPFQGIEVADTAGWMRPVAEEPLTTSVALALLDCWPLAVLPTFDRVRPATSVAIHFQLFHPLPQPDDGWYRSRVTCDVNRQGYSDQLNTLWSSDGRLVGRSHQLVAVLR